MIDFKDGRQRPTNFINVCNIIADSYPYGVPHGVQKDAIQNAMDAARAKTKKAVAVKFELVDNEKGRFFVIRDSNTVGLTGPVLEVEDYESELPDHYHWARFESFAFTKDDPDAIGARGQGKFIFLRASKTYTMYYDTLREDRLYRLGGTQAQQTGCPMLPPSEDEPWEGQRGARELLSRCAILPLDLVGTRIIIVDPIDELVEELRDSRFLRAIEETWFRAIEKKRLAVSLSYDGNTLSVTLPPLYPLPQKDVRHKQRVWVIRENSDKNRITISGAKSYRVKHFHAVHFDGAVVPEQMRGIAVIHNDMKITSEETNLYPPHMRERVTGFIEFDRDLDRELRKGENQRPNHYDLRWRRRLPKAIREYVRAQLEDFGKSKLGIGLQPREARKRRRASAEQWAMRQLMRFARDLDLFAAKGPKCPPPDVPPGEPKEIGVSITDFTYPDTDIAPRVNWGHKFQGLRVKAYNRTAEAKMVAVSLHALRGDSTVLQLVDRRRFELKRRSPRWLGPLEITVDRKTFPVAGEYRLKATLFDTLSGDRIDAVTRRFWVEKDPPLRMPFEPRPTRGFPEPNEHRQWLTSGSINSSATLYYNVSHPAYLAVEEDEEGQGDYLFQVVLEGAIHFILNRPDQEDGAPDFHPLHSDRILGRPNRAEPAEIPSKTSEEIARYLSEVRWRMMKEE